MALGSDTGGSIRQPSSFCGVTGMKPTYGTVSRYGLIAYGSSLDQIGPVAKDVTDCAALLQTVASYDAKDATSMKRDDYDFMSALKEDVSDLKIGIPISTSLIMRFRLTTSLHPPRQAPTWNDSTV